MKFQNKLLLLTLTLSMGLFSKCGKTQDKVNAEYLREQQTQSILNRRVIDQLVESGDDLTKEREVFHWIYFKTPRDRKKFLKKIAGDNFTVNGEGYEDSPGKYGYKLVIKRVDKVDHASVDQYALYLWNLANETNGDYDGWETSVER